MRKLSMHALLAIITSFVMTGCASGYKEFYTPSSGATPEEISANRASTPPATPLVERSAFGDADQIVDRYAKRGYVIIGESHFNSGERVSEEDALEQGKAVGADLVLVYLPKYTGSITSSMPITTPPPALPSPQEAPTLMALVARSLLTEMPRLPPTAAPPLMYQLR
ncbi:hypothetical protein [Pseudomonas syringae]|uniref:hypothetical protein n=1 Tax=Pseudomonas syringae TaxID=317 RepID=UPI001F197EFE|nr:hypothetical protein [Pseudomonas syringae]